MVGEFLGGVGVLYTCRADWERKLGPRTEFDTLEPYTAFTRHREADNSRI